MSLHPKLLEYLLTFEKLPTLEPEHLATVGTLSVHRGSGSLGDLTPFTGVVAVGMFEWSDVPIHDLAKLPQLKSITLRDCDIEDLSPLTECKLLKAIDLDGCLVRDLSPLRPIVDQLWDLVVVGCPLDEASYEWLRSPGVPSLRDFPPEAWRITCKLNQRGLRLSAFPDDYGKIRVNAPGFEGSKLGLVVASEATVDAILAEHSHLDERTFLDLAREIRKREREQEREREEEE